MTYETWNDQRRATWFDADNHTHWDTFANGEIVANWNPSTGRCYIKQPNLSRPDGIDETYAPF